jgi:hypothetical protein
MNLLNLRRYLGLFGPGRVVRIIGRLDRVIRQLDKGLVECAIVEDEVRAQITELDQELKAAITAGNQARALKINLSKLLTA